MKINTYFDVIVVGGGHAGTEAALASARIGANTLLLTQTIDTLGQLSCNPSIGGIGKSHLVREIDALGGIMALAADKSGIQWRILNASKGAAVRATRAQVDRHLYKQAIRETLENQDNLLIFQSSVVDLILEKDTVVGVITQMGLTFHSRSIVLTAGTFLNGKIHIGLSNYEGGRAGDSASTSLAVRLRELPLRIGRLKTGTPPRLDGRSINFSELQSQDSEENLPVFSYRGCIADHPRQVSCFITRTNENTHEIIRNGLNESPLYNGRIEGIGPRYCPSIEDKVMRFSEKSSHQIFLEPEGLTTHEFYPNGLSTSLPFYIQKALINSLKGLEKAHLTRPGYAIEYDFFDPRDLLPSLESQILPGLFCAGQINGTTGYEEAAAQGLIAGLNAALKACGKSTWFPRRDQAYIGVLIDDLITKGTIEPYRMFTSRAEYRLLLREDNADLRLTEIGHDLGLVAQNQWKNFLIKKEVLTQEQKRLANFWVRPNTSLGDQIEKIIKQPLAKEITLDQLLLRKEVSYKTLMQLSQIGPGIEDPIIQEQIEIQARYKGYIARQQLEIDRQLKYAKMILPKDLDYKTIYGLSNEEREKLNAHKNKSLTLDQVSRIPGITPAALSILRIYIKRHHVEENVA